MQRKTVKWEYSPIQFLESISCYIGNATSLEEHETFGNIETNKCVVCLQTRRTTWLFMPCKQANCCTQCSDTIEQLQQTCPTCRGIIKAKFKNFLN